MQSTAPTQANWGECMGIRACCFFPLKDNSKASNCTRSRSRSCSIPDGLVSFRPLFRRGSISTHSSVALRVSASPIPLGRCRPASCPLPVSKSTTIRRITHILFLPSIGCLPYCSRCLLPGRGFWVVAGPRAIELFISSFSSSRYPFPVTDISVQQSKITGDCGFLLGVIYRYTPFLNRFTGSWEPNWGSIMLRGD
ncbi:hypothetical protein ASPVEDRAFT_746450 [Aspergillus versicolor CBS 583.65]|uniref:Uncharacterized protein n=1 Tax=Aspergillus versicolor CBS 583.65 TaxID=1036611 RepID=A0A1L9PQ99_ASPVE|nr:uncharacterized protein ASPVEDRAFT_746450 [Aspergillus versicolor CBS 583.65]OJJ03673.1 hypothetical protein ASPVEDRAFT_746450 [Aspergillus versicolor CBS 583.65]